VGSQRRVTLSAQRHGVLGLTQRALGLDTVVLHGDVLLALAVAEHARHVVGAVLASVEREFDVCVAKAATAGALDGPCRGGGRPDQGRSDAREHTNKAQ